MTNEEEKQQYSSLYDLTQKIIDLSEKEISSAKNENKDVAKESICSQLLDISEKLKKSADLAENPSAKTKLLTLHKALYRCYDRNRKY